MSTKSFQFISLVVSISQLFYGPIAAQTPHPANQSWPPDMPAREAPPFWPQPTFDMEQSDGQMGAFNAQATSFSHGQPGLSFRYVQKFGVTE